MTEHVWCVSQIVLNMTSLNQFRTRAVVLLSVHAEYLMEFWTQYWPGNNAHPFSRILPTCYNGRFNHILWNVVRWVLSRMWVYADIQFIQPRCFMSIQWPIRHNTIKRMIRRQLRRETGNTQALAVALHCIDSDNILTGFTCIHFLSCFQNTLSGYVPKVSNISPYLLR